MLNFYVNSFLFVAAVKIYIVALLCTYLTYKNCVYVSKEMKVWE